MRHLHCLSLESQVCERTRQPRHAQPIDCRLVLHPCLRARRDARELHHPCRLMVAQVFDPLFGLSTTRRDTARRLRSAGALVVVASNKQTCGGQAVQVLGDCVLAPLGTVAPALTPHKRLIVENSHTETRSMSCRRSLRRGSADREMLIFSGEQKLWLLCT